MRPVAPDAPLPRLETERLVVAAPDPTHAPRLLAYSLANRAHFAPWDPPYPPSFDTIGYWERWVVRAREEYAAGISARFVVTSHEAPEGPVIAQANLTGIMRGPLSTCYLGYKIAADQQGRGLMREACEAVIDHAFGALALHRVQANYVPTNERSGELLRRLGFVVEGYARDYLFIGGRFRDHVLTAKTNPGWPADRAPP